MTVDSRRLHLCNCNRTMPLDAAELARALGVEEALPVHEQMCQRGLAAFGEKVAGDALVACTQEAKLLQGVAAESARVNTVRFFNIREHGGWSAEAKDATPKIAALIAAAALPEPEPVTAVSYRSQGQVLVIGPASQALACAALLPAPLAVSVLATRNDGAPLPVIRNFPVYSGALQKIEGWLGAFQVTWRQDNPIDLDACVRCGACVKACPEHAIDGSYQVDLDRCRDHRDCVAACGEVKAIDFDRADTQRVLPFDLVLDLSDTSAFIQHQAPQGYFAPLGDGAATTRALLEITQAVGEFEKPKYYAYKESLCAHSRSKKTGCTRCIDVCSTLAIRSAGERIAVESHLCMGCGACTTVCPSGALGYAYPRVPDLGARVKTALATYRGAGGRDACILFHAAGTGEEAIARLARQGEGLPARVIPLAVHHVASVGMDVWLGTLAYGASNVVVLYGGDEAPWYRDATATQMAIAEDIVQALGYQDTHLVLAEANGPGGLAQALAALSPALAVRVPAAFNWTSDKRTTLSMAIDHLLEHAPVPQQVIALKEGAPFGTLRVNADTCTLCLACVGACPEGALADGAEMPQLRFIETRCVQCGLCENTCPEHAITLEPRLLLGPEARQARVLHEAAVFHCISCNTPLGTQKMMDAMLSKIGGHSMWQAPGALDRLKMCADCRVKDMMKKELI